MSDFELVKCGKCVGCKLEQEQAETIKRMDDEVFVPRLQRLAELYDPRGSQIKPDHRSHQSRAIMKERDALLEERSRFIDDVLKQYGYPGCCHVVLIPRLA